MDPGRWEQIEALFFGALDRDPAEREAFLDAASADDPVLRGEVEAMLAAHAHSQSLLLENRLLTGASIPLPDPDALLGTHIGPYRLKTLLGQGGMGTVYLAERADAQYRQEVALKLIRPGLRTAEVVTRFRVERQILARLQHPHIARLLDGGMTGDGQPYLVMEYVEGLPITTYCDAHRLPIAGRLRLFQLVCQAVQFAHRNLVVHRDLKPTNILVTSDGQVKLLDFGIAKLLDPTSAGVSVAPTRSTIRVMTPEYAAPEQVRGAAITTATDVYALGVLLYELLTGHRPYRLPERRQAEVERIICEEVPTRPSTAIAAIEERARADGTTETLTPERVSAARNTMLGRLQRTLRGDLDNIVMMALRKEPERRYASAEQVAEDIGRYLAGQLVIARRDTLAYRVSKFVRRHRVGVGVAAGFVLVLIGFSGVTVWQAQTVARERDTARAERDKAEQALLQAEEVTGFLMGLFEANDPSEAQGDTITAQELLARGVARAGELAGQPAVQARMLDVMGQVYRHLGQYDSGQPLLEQAVVRWRLLHEPAELARSLNHLGLLLLDQGQFAEAETLLQEADSLHRDLYPTPHPAWAESLHNLGGLFFEQGNYAAADSLFRAALALRKDLLGEDHPLTIRTLRMLTRGLDKLGMYEEAGAVLQEGLEQQRRRFGGVHPDVANTLNDLAVLLKKKGDLDAAGSLYRESLEVRRVLYGDVHPRVGVALVNYAKLLMEQDAYGEAAAPLSEALSIFRTVHGPDHPDVAWALENLARTYVQSGAYERALPAYREALALQRRTLGPEHPRPATTMIALASALVDLKQYPEAQELYQQSLAIYREAFGDKHAELATVHRHLGRLYHRQGRFADAERHLRTSVDIYRQVLPPGHLRTASALLSYGELLLDQGAPSRAEPLLREGSISRQNALPENSRPVAEAKGALGACLALLGRYDEAEPLLLFAYEHAQDAPRPESLYTQAYAVMKEKLGAGSLLRSETAFELGRRRAARGDHAGALPLFEDAATVPIAGSDRAVELSARAAHAFGTSLLALDRPAEAEPHLRTAYEALRHIFGDANAQTLTVRRDLEAVQAALQPPGR